VNQNATVDVDLDPRRKVFAQQAFASRAMETFDPDPFDRSRRATVDALRGSTSSA
jgi:hypothetical protein